jgi:hypothetical protein
MTTTFESDQDVIIYALEKIISFARDNQYIFLAQSIWWISSIIGLQQELVIHIDKLRGNVSQRPTGRTGLGASDKSLGLGIDLRESCTKSVSSAPIDHQEEPRDKPDILHIHKDRLSQIEESTDMNHLDTVPEAAE